MSIQTNNVCPSCQNIFRGRYCSYCGEKRLAPEDLKVRSFLKNALVTLLSTDGKLLHTLKQHLGSPGVLTNAYISGKRTPYLKPLQLFLLANVLYFFLATLGYALTFNTPLYWHMNAVNFPHRPVAELLVTAERNSTGETLEDYSQRFNNLVDSFSKTIVIVLIPLFFLPLQFLKFKSKEPPLKQLVFSVHFISFVLMLSLLFFLIQLLTPALSGETVYSWTSITLIALYVLVSLKRVYDKGYLRSGLEAIILSASFYVVVILYRGLLFFITFYSLKWIL
ncbi:MAG: DUF3667 domain-containing protein [Calditrichota bacterium]